ncbi:MAG: twin-arginine translocation signal domain-containing protein, partial [Chloroflexota bacterium]
MKKLSRRDFLKFGSAAAASATLGLSPFGSMLTSAQDAELSLQTWGHFISSSNDLLTSLVNSWAASSGTSVEINYTGFNQLADTLATGAAT